MTPKGKKNKGPPGAEDQPSAKKRQQDLMGDARKTAMKRDGFKIVESDTAMLGIVNFGFQSTGDSDGSAMQTDAKPIPDVAVIKIFDDAELEVLRLEMRQAIDHMPEFKAPTNLYNTKGELQDSLYDDDEQLLVGGGFGALANPGSFHNHFVRRLRRKVQEKLLQDDVFGLEEELSEHKGMLIEQVIDRMMVRRPGSEPQAESWHRDVARGTCSGDKVYGGWLNLDPPLGPTAGDGAYQYFSCMPKSASDAGANENAGFARDAPSPERIAEQSHWVRIPPGWLIIFNELTLHEVLKTQAKRRMSRVFFGWRLSKSKHHFLPERYVDASRSPEDVEQQRALFEQMEAAVFDAKTSAEQLAQFHRAFPPMKCRYPMFPDLVARFQQQEGMPLKSGQHPERDNRLTAQHGPMRVPANHDSQNRYEQPSMAYYKTGDGGTGQIQPNKHFKTYPCGPPNWPHLWTSTNDPRVGLLKFSYGAIERVVVQSEDGTQQATGRDGVLNMPLQNFKFFDKWNKARYCTKNTRTDAFTEADMVDNTHIWADHMPMLELRWASAKLGNRWPNGVVGVPQTFMGLKDYERMQKDDGAGAVLDGRSADGRRSAYVSYAMSEVMLHFPLTAREAKHYLGMDYPGMDKTAKPSPYRYHKAKPFVWEPEDYMKAFANHDGDPRIDPPPAGMQRNPLPPVPTHLQQYLHSRGGEVRPHEELVANRDASLWYGEEDYQASVLAEYKPFRNINPEDSDPGARGSAFDL